MSHTDPAAEYKCTGWPVPDDKQEPTLATWRAELANILVQENYQGLRAQVIYLDTEQGTKQALGVVGDLPTAEFDKFIKMLGEFSVAHDRRVRKPDYIVTSGKNNKITSMFYLP